MGIKDNLQKKKIFFVGKKVQLKKHNKRYIGKSIEIFYIEK